MSYPLDPINPGRGQSPRTFLEAMAEEEGCTMPELMERLRAMAKEKDARRASEARDEDDLLQNPWYCPDCAWCGDQRICSECGRRALPRELWTGA